LLRGDAGLSSFRPEQLQALALFSLKLHSTAFSIAIVFFGIHCVLVGYLIYRSGFVPRIFGALWMLARYNLRPPQHAGLACRAPARLPG